MVIWRTLPRLGETATSSDNRWRQQVSDVIASNFERTEGDKQFDLEQSDTASGERAVTLAFNPVT